jgi:transcriptional regulator GlxA family with amidase domain
MRKRRAAAKEDALKDRSRSLQGIRKPTREPHGVRKVVMLAVSPVVELDVVGPIEVFASANKILRARGPAYEIQVVTTEADCIIAGEAGLSLIAHRHYREVSGKVDTLLVSGGHGAITRRDRVISAWLRRWASKARRVSSICIGAFLLAEAGLLNGRRATTHWSWANELVTSYPQIAVDPNPIWVQDGKIYTSAGVTAGIDLCLALVEEDYGSDLALDIARGLVVFLRRPGGQAQFSVSLSAQASDLSKLQELQMWMAENLGGDLSVETLASRCAMSPRNFARVFVRELGTTPARYVAQLRIEAARRLIEEADCNLDEIASTCGFNSAEVMRRAFRRSLKIAPSQYRDRFGDPEIVK